MQERSEEFEREIRALEDKWRRIMGRAVALTKSGENTARITEKLRNARVMLNQCIYDEHAHIDEQQATRAMIEEAAREVEAAVEALPEEEKDRILAQQNVISEFKRQEFKDIPKAKHWIRVLASEVKKESMSEIEKIGGITVESQGNALIIKGEKEALSKAKEVLRHGHR